MFLFLQMFLLLIAFVHFTFFHSVCQVLCFCVVTASATNLRESFLPYTPSCFYQGFLELAVLPWRLQVQNWGCHWGSKHRPSPSVCLNHTLFANNMISRELYINLSKHVDKLLVAKSFINLSKFFQKYYHLIDYF